MVDSLNLLGTTRDITDLLEFIWKLLADTQDIYVSADGQHTNHTTISTIANDVHRLGDIITVSVADDDTLKGLVKESKKIATDLLKALDQLKVQGRNTVWKSFMLALKNVWKDRNIQAFSHRLATLQSQVACHCQAVILKDVSGISRKLADLEDMNQALGTDIRTEIRQLRDDIKSAAERLNPEDPAYGVHPMMKRLKVKGDTGAFDKQLVDDITSNLRYFSGKISHLYKTSKATDDIHNVLQSLNFDRRSLRERKIPKAHARTFDWIFRKNVAKENTSLSFVDWLQNRNGIFWIRGKAGSGKSTLMKFLPEHQETKRHLRSWAGNQTLIVARFFFWYAGLPLQKSQEGLLRSLLFEILRQCPSLIPRVLAIRSQFRDDYDDDDSWTPEELLSVCRGILGGASDSRFCFFIDGLDEYEESGMTPTDLIKTIKSLGDSPNIKLCVSSRPWSAFVDEFGQHPESLLKLEDLTQGDIRRYVVDKFGESQQFIQAKEGYLAELDLVESVCRKAAGVFLWVYLVVRDLLHGLTNGDSVSLLRQRLEGFPEDLEDYFQHMIDTIPSIYLGHAARAFDIARSAAEPPVILAFSFMDEAEEGYSVVWMPNAKAF
ncbi:hypothetical protein THARTR1_01248 [Trichoderma harzianum]|uniref:Nephrocystin 3-like N-terminal domain-containing protein n=1 Tax=Trichoderma harzianum TaxID=5544 RepID=A0A2K0UMI6_TRIHA|nr:hypothetical protein THARTR1_01248 [Trichoderma harzianum]